MHLGLFGCLTKLGAKPAELVQKFVPQSRVGIFWNERTRTSAKVHATKSRRTFRDERTQSTPLDNILTFWCVRTIWVHSGLFSCLTKLVAKRAELVQKFVKQSHVEHFATNAPDPPHWTLN